MNLTKQDYSKKPVIDGVQLIPVPYFVDDGGYFLELGRWQEAVFNHVPEFKLEQVNLSEMDPGVIKAWHIHKNQEDIWFVPPSHKLLVALKDIREDSKTKGVTMRFVLGGGKPQLVLIPRGVAHGAANLWNKPAVMVYLINQQFTPEADKSDEYRLPWDEFGKEIWDQTKG